VVPIHSASSSAPDSNFCSDFPASASFRWFLFIPSEGLNIFALICGYFIFVTTLHGPSKSIKPLVLFISYWLIVLLYCYFYFKSNMEEPTHFLVFWSFNLDPFPDFWLGKTKWWFPVMSCIMLSRSFYQISGGKKKDRKRQNLLTESSFLFRYMHFQHIR
jgi:hypothetical protein